LRTCETSYSSSFVTFQNAIAFASLFRARSILDG